MIRLLCKTSDGKKITRHGREVQRTAVPDNVWWQQLLSKLYFHESCRVSIIMSPLSLKSSSPRPNGAYGFCASPNQWQVDCELYFHMCRNSKAISDGLLVSPFSSSLISKRQLLCMSGGWSISSGSGGPVRPCHRIWILTFLAWSHVRLWVYCCSAGIQLLSWPLAGSCEVPKTPSAV